MPLFRPRGVPEFVTPPREPSRAELQQARDERVAVLDEILTVQASPPAQFRRRDLIDDLLDARLAIRPAVPVNPGPAPRQETPHA